MLAAMNDEQAARPRDVGTLRTICHGGSPVATETLRRAHAAFPDAELVHIYGATELSPIATTMRARGAAGSTRPGSAPAASPPSASRSPSSSPDGVPVPAGEVGEVVVRGPQRDGRLLEQAGGRRPQALAGGWYHTGDLGYLDDEAFVYLVDRAKDMIVTGGENVYSTEVEDVLYRHPGGAGGGGVRRARRPLGRGGARRRRAAVGRRPRPSWSRTAGRDIAGYKVPKRIELRDEPLPKSGAGKVLKRELREPYWQEREARVGG